MRQRAGEAAMQVTNRAGTELVAQLTKDAKGHISALCSTWRNAVSNCPSLIPSRSTIFAPIINPKPTSL